MIEGLYAIATLLLSPLAALILWCTPRGRIHLWDRFGLWHLQSSSPILWFHGASVGEINGLIPLLHLCRSAVPEYKVLITATSVTGLERAASVSDFQRLLPFDHRWFLWFAMHRLQVKAFVFGETELWPGLLEVLARQNVPMFMVNARISDKTIRFYLRFKIFFAKALRRLTKIFAESQRSYDRLALLGADKERLVLAGNAKYDFTPSVATHEAALALKQKYFRDDAPTIVLGSLRPGEEDFWFPELASWKEAKEPLNVLIAPRHQEKFDYFADKLRANAIRFVHSSQSGYPSEPDGALAVTLLDELGKLESCYSFADAAFIGGTIADYGGHNPLEAAAYGACIAMGPYTQNIAELTQLLVDRNAVIEVRDLTDIEALISRVTQRDPSLQEVGQRGREVWKESSGASERIMGTVLAHIQERNEP